MKITINAEKAALIDTTRATVPRDTAAELDALKAALAKKNVVTDADIKAAIM